MNKSDKRALKGYFISVLRLRREVITKFPDPGAFVGIQARQLSRDVLHSALCSGLIEDYDLGKNTVTMFGEEVTENDRV